MVAAIVQRVARVSMIRWSLVGAWLFWPKVLLEQEGKIRTCPKDLTVYTHDYAGRSNSEHG